MGCFSDAFWICGGCFSDAFRILGGCFSDAFRIWGGCFSDAFLMAFRIAFRMAYRTDTQSFLDILTAVMHFLFQALLTLRERTGQTLTLQAG